MDLRRRPHQPCHSHHRLQPQDHPSDALFSMQELSSPDGHATAFRHSRGRHPRSLLPLHVKPFGTLCRPFKAALTSRLDLADRLLFAAARTRQNFRLLDVTRARTATFMSSSFRPHRPSRRLHPRLPRPHHHHLHRHHLHPCHRSCLARPSWCAQGCAQSLATASIARICPFRTVATQHAL